ncbi:hypothetical protein PSTG_16103 [Puccinia striiformis f. sp. tritici PST-78]|uniref:Uncharacterized protein n=1 Tax=Puccinia striiformis f. sp. tritici PST-78 TaxID=1165861 RepID=A0A0L0UU18_9BASI|nr:hypothetical protein PSTG_16103 [Puccinia striiformis f. sp. tritici PST-78]
MLDRMRSEMLKIQGLVEKSSPPPLSLSFRQKLNCNLDQTIERKWSLDVCAGRLSSCGAATLSRSFVAEQDRNLDHITLQDHHHHDQNDGEDEEDNDDGADDDTLQIEVKTRKRGCSRSEGS